MANIKSAKKRILVSERNAERNKAIKSGVKTSVKKVYAAIESGDKAAAQTALTDATKTIDITVSPEQFIPGMNFGAWFFESGEMIPGLTGGEYSFIVIDAPTGIDTITQNEEKKATEVIYDIYGQKVKSMEKGRIYITGGKKVIAK